MSALRDVCDAHTAGMALIADGPDGLMNSGRVVGSFAGLPLPPFNGIYVWEDGVDVVDGIDHMVRRGSDRGLPMMISVPAGSSQEHPVEVTAHKHGFVDAGPTQAAMILDTARPIPDLPSHLRCTSPAGTDLAPVNQIMLEAFGMPIAVSEQIGEHPRVNTGANEWMTLWNGDEVVACSMLSQCTDVAALFNVGVPQRHRRQGYGAAATWEAVRRAEERGATRATLLASALGEPVYDRMGFTTVGRIRNFVRV